MSIIARLGAVLGLDTKEFVKGVDAAQQKSKEFKKNLKETQQTIDGMKTAFAAAGAAFVAFAAAAMHAADEIADLADANETSIGKVLELRSALIMSGGDAQKVGQFYSSFTNAIDGAAQGSDKLRDSFAAVGVSIRDIGTLSQQELQSKTLRGLSQIDDQVRRNALGFELFGKAAKGVNFSAMAGNAEDAAGGFERQAEAIRAAADAAQKIQMFFGDMQIAALAAIKPVSDLINKIPAEDRIEAMTKAFQALGIAIGVAFGVTAVKGVIAFASALRVIAISNPWLLALTAAGGAAAYLGMDKLMGEEPETLDESELGTAGKQGFKRDIEESNRDKMRKKYDTDLAIMKSLFKLRSDFAKYEYDQNKLSLELEGKRADLSTNEYNRRLLYLQLADEELKALRDHETALEEARTELRRASSEEFELAKRNYDEKVALLERAYDDELAYRQKLEKMRVDNHNKEIERQQSWEFGWNQAFKQYSETAEKASLRGAAAFDSVVSNMETALRTFVETGKLNFKDFVGSVIKDLLYMEMKAQATMIFRQIWGSFTELLGPGTIGANIGKKASGGYIDRPSLVGENGPELFIPRTPGTIIPQGSWQQMASSGGGGLTVNGNYIANMSAIDTQSATQFLASNKQTIWAAYQSANRMVPISR
jgi:lambda family phage tail tape measure protein